MSSALDTTSDKKPLSPGWMGVAIAVLPPLGLYLLWRHPVLGKQKGWWIGGCVWCFLWLISLGKEAPTTDHAEADSSGSSRQSASQNPGQSSRPTPKRSLWGPTQLAYKKRVDLCDNPDKYKDTEMKMEVKYNGGGTRIGGKLVSLPCMVFYGDGSFDMQFEIPSDVSQPRIEPGQYLMVTFVFSGSVDTPSQVVAISRN